MYQLIAEVVVAILAFVGTLAGSIMVSQKTTWRLDQLEKKMEKHNQLMERVAILEVNEQTQWKRIDELRDELEAQKK